MGERPCIYLTLMREDLPAFSIIDKQIKLIINHDGENIRSPLQYLVIQNKCNLELPKFIEMDMRKFNGLDQLNKFI
jgi:hypothetical protein